jgi:hypothetical protein
VSELNAIIASRIVDIFISSISSKSLITTMSAISVVGVGCGISNVTSTAPV